VVVTSPATITDAGLDQGLAGDAGARVLREDGVEHGVGDLVGDLVRVAFGDGLGGEQLLAMRAGS
jgi:hypothetical protein